MTMPLTEGLLTVPYVGLAEFKASPTYLDTDDLVVNGTPEEQDAELYNQLLKASAWAWNFCSQPLHGHIATEETMARVDSRGRIWLHPKNVPVRQILGVAYGPSPDMIQPIPSTNLVTWVEDARGIAVVLSGLSTAALGTLQFGSIPTPARQVYVQYQYVAGYGNGVLTSAVAAEASDLTVDNALGFQAPQTSAFSTSFGGSIARIWDPGVEEAVAVGSGYTSGANPLVLATPTVNAHLAGAQVSEFPPEIRTAVTQYAIGLMLREDTGEELPYAGSPGPVARRAGSRGVAGGLIDEAERAMMPFRRVR